MKFLLLVISTLCLASFSSAASPFTGCTELGTLLTCSNTANAFEARIAGTTGTYQLLTFTGKTASTYPDNYFTGLTLATIVSQNNHVTTIGDNVFTGATSVTEFSLQESDLQSTTSGAFAPIATTLKKLSIISSAITPTRMNGIATGLASLNQLEELILSGNNLLTVSSSWFTGLTSLKVLDLSSNSILDTTAIFAALSPLSASLQTLTLTTNSIAQVSDLPSMTALTTINLDSNQITGFASTTPFANAPALTSIKLNINKLTAVPNIAGNPAILDLDLNNQTGSTLTTIADSSFSRNSVTNQAVINLDTNANLMFANKAFCSSVTPDIQQVTIAWTAAANLNKCHFKQFGATAAKPTVFKVSKQTGVTDYSSFCNCANYAAAKAFFVTINSANTACDTLTDAACASTTFTDTCATDNSANYVCPAATTSGSQMIKFDLVGFLVANVVFMFAYKQF